MLRCIKDLASHLFPLINSLPLKFRKQKIRGFSVEKWRSLAKSHVKSKPVIFKLAFPRTIFSRKSVSESSKRCNPSASNVNTSQHIVHQYLAF
ncbi:Hypothetical predicted protein [Olea europaea subsp. europaea]|uniref:Uncharacterized protein n=1 Tax=Olea europaea subsp. europaea TaxID=158383 RepID=A0A8S0RR18_OLEEU|nr:Hypothetical predicted protein [Olea europaea subsp. europaea]